MLIRMCRRVITLQYDQESGVPALVMVQFKLLFSVHLLRPRPMGTKLLLSLYLCRPLAT